MSNKNLSSRYLRKAEAMAVKKDDWAKIKKDHYANGADVVDHTAHLADHPAPEVYKKVVGDGQEYSSVDNEYKSVGKKIIHRVTDEHGNQRTIMTKPYHARPRSNTILTKHPIKGWATIATKSLFHAGGIPNLIEDVSTHVHDGIPVTVHNFASGYRSVYDVAKEQYGIRGGPMRRTVSPLQLQQIAAMDFLTGNVERHTNNLFVASHASEQGHHDLLAIDHDSNFQYVNNLAKLRPNSDDFTQGIRRKYDKPSDYIRNTALKEAQRASYDNGWEDFHLWWTESSDKILAEFKKQLTHIKSKRVREHVERNFMHRFEILNRWASKEEENNHLDMDFFDDNNPVHARIMPMPREPKEKIDAILARLPQDAVQAVLVVAKLSGQQAGVATTKKLTEIFHTLLDRMSAEDMSRLYESIWKKPAIRFKNHVLSTEVLLYIWDRQSVPHAQAILKLDNHTGKISPFWRDRLLQLTGATDEVTLQESGGR